jgi:hypothetical protein
MADHAAETGPDVAGILAYAKAIAAFLGSIVTALLGVLPPEEYRWLVIVGVVCTAVATYAIPNRKQ